jgi:hypothetical protein
MSIELRSIRHARQFFAGYRNVGLTEAALLQGSGIAPLQEKKANGLIFGETNGVIERLSCFVVTRQSLEQMCPNRPVGLVGRGSLTVQLFE